MKRSWVLIPLAIVLTPVAANASMTRREDCSDGIDNDNNGLIDCADDYCAYSCAESNFCADGIDNDQDGRVDCHDSDCNGASACENGGDGGTGTPDESPPAFEDICDNEVGALFGLCTAYCEAMDCHLDFLADKTACDKVLTSYLKKSGGGDPPCLEDSCTETCGAKATESYFGCMNGGVAACQHVGADLQGCCSDAGRQTFSGCWSACSKGCANECGCEVRKTVKCGTPEAQACYDECAGEGGWLPPTEEQQHVISECDPGTQSCP